MADNLDDMMSDEDVSALSEKSSDLDSDDLEEVPAIIRQLHNSDYLNSSTSYETTSISSQKESRLDALLEERKQEREKDERLKQLKDRLSTDIKQGSEDNYTDEEATQSLASDHADHIEQLEIKPSQLKPVHPRHTVFQDECYCCLFSGNISPDQCGFIPTGSAIDRLLTHITPAEVPKLLSSRALVTCAHQVSCLDNIMQWLLYVLSVHTSPTVVHNCHTNLIGIMHHLKMRAKSEQNAPKIWAPTALDILRIFVNLGADPSKLTVHRTAYEAEELRKQLLPITDQNTCDRNKGRLCSANVGQLLTIMANSLQSRPAICDEELSFMMYMLATAALDLTSRETFYYLENDFRLCFASVLECYSNSSWPSVVPDLCRQLSHVSDHHHNLAHLVHLLPVGARSSYLRVRLSYFFLNKLLTGRQHKISDEELTNIKLRDVAELGKPTGQDCFSELGSKLQQLVPQELYKTTSVLQLVDFCVGDELHRSTQPEGELEFVLSEMNNVLKVLKDNVIDLDVSRVKETITQMTVKWSLTLQNQRMKQRSIFLCDTTTRHQPVMEELLQNMRTAEEDSP